MKTPSSENPIADTDEAERVIKNLNAITDLLEETIKEETAHVRAGRLREAAKLGEAKADISRRYTVESMRIIAARELIAGPCPTLMPPCVSGAARPGSAANQHDRAGDRPRGFRGHHSRRAGRTRPQARTFDLWSHGPHECAEPEGKSAAGHLP